MQRIKNTVFPRIIAGEIIDFFMPKGGDYLREAIISNTRWKSCTKYFAFI